MFSNGQSMYTGVQLKVTYTTYKKYIQLFKRKL
jgi:hypothetical protein